MSKTIGSVIVVAAHLILLSFFILPSGCSPPAKPLAALGVPVDFEVRWGSGGTHAEWGREEGTLNAQGDLVWVKSRGYGSDAVHEESRGHATKAQMDALWRAFGENRFFQLKKSYDNPFVNDGFSSFIAIAADGRSHSVAVSNTSQERFSKVMAALDEIRRSVIPEEQTEKTSP